MNQVDPKTGIINFEIGKDLLKRTSEGQDVDFATERESVENSAHFMRSVSENVTGNTSGDGYLGKTELSPGLVILLSLCLFSSHVIANCQDAI